MSEIKKYTINIWLKNNGAPFIYRNCIAYEKGSFYCVYDGEAVYKYPLSDIWRVSESYPQDMQGKNNHNALWQKSVDSEERAHLEKLVPDLKKRIAELEAEIDQLTAHDATERQDDKCSKPEPNVCEACGGDGTVLLTDGYEGQVIATAKCTYCNGTGRVNKEREE